VENFRIFVEKELFLWKKLEKICQSRCPQLEKITMGAIAESLGCLE